MSRLDEMEKRLSRVERENVLIKEVINEIVDDLWYEEEDDNVDDCVCCKYEDCCDCSKDCRHCGGFVPDEDDEEEGLEEDYDDSEQAYVAKCVQFYETFHELRNLMRKGDFSLSLLKTLLDLEE